MRFRVALLLAAVMALSGLVLSGLVFAPAAQAATPAKPGVIDVVEISGVIDGPTAGYLSDEIAAANRRESEILVIALDSPGAVGSAGRTLPAQVARSRIPIAVFVGPGRARAAGLAVEIAQAAHLLAMAPAARLGPAWPADLRADRDGAASSAFVAALRSLASERGRAAPAAVFDSSVSASSAATSGAVDVQASSVADLLDKVGGRAVVTAAGRVILSIDKATASVRLHKPGPVRRMLHTLAIPALVFVLLLGGAMLVVFEIFQPGFGVAGVSGAVLLAGAGYGLSVVPFRAWALAVLVGGLVLLSLDVALDGLGVPTIAGMGGLVAGSLGLFPGPAGVLRQPAWLAVLGGVAALVFFVPVMTMVRKARHPIGREFRPALLGQPAQVRSVLNPEGFVWAADALWRARASDGTRVRVGEDVRIVGIEGTLLKVSREVEVHSEA